MKVLMLADSGSVHTTKWVKSLMAEGVELILFSLYSDCSSDIAELVDSGHLKLIAGDSAYQGSILDRKFAQRVSELKKVIRAEQPDILHAHYASSYGLLGALSGFQPYLVSVWGSDVYGFPKRGFLFKQILKYNLRKARHILSSSAAMRTETLKYTAGDVTVIPFGVDTQRLKPVSRDGRPTVTIGTIKSLSPVYGIDLLIRAFAEAVACLSEMDVRLDIVGSGVQRAELEALCLDLGVAEFVQFHGAVDHSEIARHLSSFDVFAALSREESFGVAIVEAMSCGLPVLVSDAPGPAEIVSDGLDGFVVPRENVTVAANKMVGLVIDEELRKCMGKEGRAKVLRQYDWDKNVKQMMSVYEEHISHSKN